MDASMTPCKDCKDRIVGKDRTVDCHSTCERYKAFKDAIQEKKEQAAEQKKVDEFLFDQKMKSVKRNNYMTKYSRRTR